MRLPCTAGTTASIIFIKNNKYYTGHVGDSRIVIARENPKTKNWISHDLTVDHKPESEEELSRIEEAGGSVKPKLGIHRVVWSRPILHQDVIVDPSNYRFPVPREFVSKYVNIPFLSVGRSLGDFWSFNPDTNKYVVSPEPDVHCEPVSLKDKGIILASDGLWNVLHSPLAVRLLQQLSKRATDDDNQNESQEYRDIDNYYCMSEDGNCAQVLVDIAFQNWEWRNIKADNITAVVVRFNDEYIDDAISTYKEVCTDCFCKSPRQGIIDDTFMRSLEPPSQITKTSKTYYEPFQFAKLPHLVGDIKFCPSELRFYRLGMARLPPSISRLTTPVNYERLSSSSYKKLFYNKDTMEKVVRICDLDQMTRTILVAHATDDPEDLKEKQTRINANRKVVSDSSCQATQPMHDFGQSWINLMRTRTGLKTNFIGPRRDRCNPQTKLDDVLDHHCRNGGSFFAHIKDLQDLVYPNDYTKCRPDLTPIKAKHFGDVEFDDDNDDDYSKTPKTSNSKFFPAPQSTVIPRSPKRRRTLATSDDENKVLSAVTTRNQSSLNLKKSSEIEPSSSPTTLLKMRLRSRESFGSKKTSQCSLNATHPLPPNNTRNNHPQRVVRRAKSWQTRSSDKISKLTSYFASSSRILMGRSSRRCQLKRNAKR